MGVSFHVANSTNMAKVSFTSARS